MSICEWAPFLSQCVQYPEVYLSFWDIVFLWAEGIAIVFAISVILLRYLERRRGGK